MGILVIFVFFVVLPILALIVLTCVPTFRLTFINFLLFVGGAVLGMFTLGRLIILIVGWLLSLGNHRSSLGEANDLGALAILVGMLVGGAGLVWLKMRITKKSRAGGEP